MIKYTTIATEDNNFRLVSMVDLDGRHTYFEIYDGSQLIECWDNTNYLTLEAYPYLKGKRSNSELDYSIGKFKNEILEIFEEAIKTKLLKV